MVEEAVNPCRGSAFLDQDVIGRGDRLGVLDPGGDPLEQLVRCDLEVLEGVGERGELRRGINSRLP